MSMQDLLVSQAVERAHSALSLIRNPAKADFIREIGGAFSFKRMIEGMALSHLAGAEREFLQETSKAAGQVSFDSQRVVLPLAMFSRDLTAASASGGGYLVSTNVFEPIDILRQWSVVARAGITIHAGLAGNGAVPRTTGKATGYWLSDEATQVTESQPVIGQIAITPKSAGAFVEFSRQLSIQAKSEFFIQRELLRTVGTMVDQAALVGTGATGQPLGLLSTAGIGTQSGTSLSYSGVTEMKKLVAEANAPDQNITFIGTPAVRQLLENRERATGSGFVWDGDRVASKPAHVTTDLPAGTLVCGAWSELFLGMWGGGLEFTVNPYDTAGFKTGIIQARVLVSCDVAVLQPTAFVIASSVT